MGLPVSSNPNHVTQCSGVCACSDLFWDELFVQLDDPISSYVQKLQTCRDPKDLFLYCPDMDEIVETYYWYAKGVLNGGMDPDSARFLVLPPCMHRVYATLDSIEADWDLKKKELIRVCAERERKSRLDYAQEKSRRAIVLARQKRDEEKVNKAIAYRGRDPEKLKKALSLLRGKIVDNVTYLIAASKKRKSSG